MQHFFFLNYVRIPFRDYNNLSSYGVHSAGAIFIWTRKRHKRSLPNLEYGISYRNLYQEDSKINKKICQTREMEKSLDEGSQSIVVYLHGAAWDRTTKHRCELYNVLSAMDFHVLAMDYRGYGDSSGSPDENGVIQDAYSIYNYARRMAPSKDIFIWGHSLGTGVTSRTVAELSEAGSPPTAIVLEAPFNNVPDVVRGHPVSKVAGMLPFGKTFVDKFVINSMTTSGLEMCSDKHLERIICPILVLHAQDDHIISVELARKLVEKAKEAQRMSPMWNSTHAVALNTRIYIEQKNFQRFSRTFSLQANFRRGQKIVSLMTQMTMRNVHN